MATNVNDWKRSVKAIELQVPSGNTCLARRVDLRKLLNAGSIPNLLMPIVREAMKGKQFDASELMENIDEEKITQMLELMDTIVLECILQPQVHPVPMRTVDGKPEPVPTTERDESKLYIDEVDFEDRQFIFNWAVGGTKDLERFRQEQASYMEGVHTGEGSQDTTSDVAGDQ